MQQREFWGYQVELDQDATVSWYAGADKWGCTCGHCRNFLTLAQQRALPAPMMEALDSLGLPLEKATYVCMNIADEQGFHYQVSYRIVGKILHTPENRQHHGWGDGCCCHEPYPYGAPGFPEPHFDLEFWLTLPWVLEESPNG